MKTRFRVDQAASFRAGIDTADAIMWLDINPVLLPENQRALISKHLLGSDVVYDPKRALQEYEPVPIGEHPPDELVQAKYPTLDSLLAALAELEPQNDSNVHLIQFCAEKLPTQKVRSV